MLNLQGTLGNQAVQRLMAGQNFVQRCGGDIHAGCDCADKENAKAKAAQMVMGEEFANIRQVGDPAIPQALSQIVEESGQHVHRQSPSSCSWPPADPEKPPMPKHIKSLDGELKKTLLESYKKHQGAPAGPGEDFMANGFFGTDPANKCSWPQTFWKALDNYDLSAMSAMTEVRDLTQRDPTLWSFIKLIRNAFSTTSRGFGFLSSDLSGLKQHLNQSSIFCSDNPITEAIFHPGKDCWRELDKLDKPGLHVCLGSGGKHDIHVDMHSPATGKGLAGVGGFCTFTDLGALERHRQDLNLKNPLTAFRHHTLLLSNARSLRKNITAKDCGPLASFMQGQADDIIKELNDIEIKRMAMEGFKGEKELTKALKGPKKKLDSLRQQMSTLCKPRAQACVPAGRPIFTLVAFQEGKEIEPPLFTPKDADAAQPSDLAGLKRGDGLDFGTWQLRPRVNKLQQKLILQGADLTTDGKFGQKTVTMLNQLQSRLGLPEQNRVDPVTATVLELNIPKPEDTPRLSQLEGLKRKDGIDYGTWELRPRVRTLQERLTAHGHPCKIDGMFGDETTGSLNAFQTENELVISDKVDRPTADALEGRTPGPHPVCPPGQTPAPIEV